jgi:hypothetical protein
VHVLRFGFGHAGRLQFDDGFGAPDVSLFRMTNDQKWLMDLFVD